MKSPLRALVVALTAASLATPAAGNTAAPRHSVSHSGDMSHSCRKTYTLRMFKRAARATYSGTDSPPKGSYGRLWRDVRCQRPPSSPARARRVWWREQRAWAARRHARLSRFAPRLAYGRWAIPEYIVQCESGGRNLPPNSASASGYYQIIVSTWDAYGGSAFASQAYLASKSGQDTIASRIWDGGRGRSQWVCA